MATKKVTVKKSAPRKATSKKTTTKKKGKKTVGKKRPAVKKNASEADSVEEWMESINKSPQFRGHSQVEMASQVRTPYYLRRPFPLLSMNIALSGGLPAGGAVEINGAESCGKTFLSYALCGMLQSLLEDEARVYIWKTENRQEKGFARLANFCIPYSEPEIEELDKMRRLQGHPSFTPEDIDDLRYGIGKTAIGSFDTADKGFDALLKALEWGKFQVALIDSLGSLLTKAEEDKDVGDTTVAGPSKLITRFQNKAGGLYMLDRPDGKMLETTIIGISQLRSNIGASKYERKEKSSTGTWAWKHAQLINIALRRGQKIRDSKSKIIGHEVSWTLMKGKAGTHDGKSGKFDYFHFPRTEPVFWRDVQEYWLGGLGIYEDAAAVAKELGVAEGSSWITWNDQKFHGNDAFAQFLADNKDAYDEVWEQCHKAANILRRYD